MPTRSQSAFMLILAAALIPCTGQAQIRTPRPILEQFAELGVMLEGTLDKGHPLAPALESIQEFLRDPVCRNGPSTHCASRFVPRIQGGAVDVPSADTIHAVFLALTHPNRARTANAQAFIALSQPTGLVAGVLPSQATIINGLSDFVVNRAKDEVVVTFVLDLRERIVDDPALTLILQQTVRETEDLTARNVKQIIPGLRLAFQSDLANLPTTLLDPATLAEIKNAAIKYRPTQATNITAAIATLQTEGQPVRAIARRLAGMARGETPLEAVGRLAEIERAEVTSVPVRSALITTGIVAREFRLSGGSLKQPMADPVGREIILALILRDVVNAAGPDLQPARQWAAAIADSLQTHILAMTTAVDELARALETARGSVAYGSVSGVASGLATLTNATAQVVKAARPLAAYNAAAVMDWDRAADILDRVTTLQAAVADRRYVAAVSELNLLFGSRLQQSLPPRQMKVLTLAATVAEAQSSEDVSKAFEAAADPVLSFRAKRTVAKDERGGMFGLNAYVGFSGGAEHAFAAGANGGTTGYGGLTVPIGPEWSVPVAPGRSFSVFVPLIDLGTVASFRFTNTDDAVQQTPSVTFAQLIAPGLYLALGVTEKYPISVALGAQYVPNLRKATSDNRLLNAMRLGGYVGVDVPLFHF